LICFTPDRKILFDECRKTSYPVYMNGTIEKNSGAHLMHRIVVGLLIVVGTVTGCAGMNPHTANTRIIGGYWSTDRDVIMQVRPAGHGTYEAAIFSAPGMVSSEFVTGRVVIDEILPTSDGGYRGVFVMPNGGKGVRIIMRPWGTDVLEITSGDGRIANRAMLWRRIKTPDGAPDPRSLKPQ
jgi:hypothetical protein